LKENETEKREWKRGVSGMDDFNEKKNRSPTEEGRKRLK
jgi:hypothetical protein